MSSWSATPRGRLDGSANNRACAREANAAPSARSETNTNSACAELSCPTRFGVQRVTAPTSETERVRAIYERMAGGYDRMIATWERLLFEDGRQWVCSRARGSVLEIGVGTGRNLEAYPDDVQLVGIDLSPAMLGLARARARHLGRDVDLRLGDAQALSFRPSRSTLSS